MKTASIYLVVKLNQNSTWNVAHHLNKYRMFKMNHLYAPNTIYITRKRVITNVRRLSVSCVFLFRHSGDVEFLQLHSNYIIHGNSHFSTALIIFPNVTCFCSKM